MAPFEQRRPCIHVALAPGTSEDLYRWVQIGAEEEGVPCRLVEEEGAGLVALSLAASHSSRFNIGVGVSDARIILHETHMPPQQPVLIFDGGADLQELCRLMGSNAARMIVRRPFRFADDPAPFGRQTAGVEAPSEVAVPPPSIPAPSQPPPAANYDETLDPREIAKIVVAIVQKLQERGVQ